MFVKYTTKLKQEEDNCLQYAQKKKSSNLLLHVYLSMFCTKITTL